MNTGKLASAMALAIAWAGTAAAQQSARATATILKDWLHPDDVSIVRATQALADALADLGFDVQLKKIGPDEAHDAESLVSGRGPAPPDSDSFPISVAPAEFTSEHLAWRAPLNIQPDGYCLATVDVMRECIAPRGLLQVLGHGERGLVYALQELARRVRLKQWAPGQALDVLVNPAFTTRLVSFHDNPGEAPFASRYRDPAAVLDAGFNGVIFHGLAGVCTYDAVDKRLVPEGSESRRLVLEARAKLGADIAAAKAEHLLVFLDGDEIALPSTALGLYGAEVAALGPDGKTPCFSAGKPRVLELLRATVDEVLAAFPDVDGIQVRTGEVYTQSEPMLAGNNPINGKDELHPDWGEQEKLASVLNALRDEIVEQHGKRFNARVWGYWSSAHSSPEKWTDLAARFAPDPRLTFSFKQPKTDFWRWNTLNPNFGVGPHGQWAEFQMAREYEGKGAFPSYLGRYLAQGATEVSPGGGLRAIRDAGVTGAWCWVRGGGWKGPYLQREEWVLLNTFAFSRLLWDPDADPWQLARDFAVLELGVPAERADLLDDFVAVQRDSEEAVLKGRYIGPFIAKGHLKGGSGWTPDGNWTRDDVFGVDEKTLPAQSFFKFMTDDGTVDDAIAEKQQALDAWARLMKEFDALVKGLAPTGERATQWTALRDTALYGESWMQFACHHFIGCWEAYEWDATGRGDAELAVWAAAHLDASEAAWTRHVGEIAALPGVATPYSEQGFSAERTAVRAMLAGGPAPKKAAGAKAR